MSYTLQNRIYDIHLKPHLKHMLLTLATWASDDGTGIYPANDKIAHRTSYNLRTVQRNIKALVKLGWLILRGKKFGVNLYDINMDKLSSEEEKQDNSDKMSSQIGQNATPAHDKMSQNDDKMSQNDDKMSPKSLKNQHKSSSINQSSNHQPTTHPDDEDEFLNLMESDVGKLFLKAYKRFPKTAEIPQLHKMLAQPDGCTKLVNILNRTIEKSITPQVFYYLEKAFINEPTPVSTIVHLENKYNSGKWADIFINTDNGYTTGEWASIIKS